MYILVNTNELFRCNANDEITVFITKGRLLLGQKNLILYKFSSVISIFGLP